MKKLLVVLLFVIFAVNAYGDEMDNNNHSIMFDIKWNTLVFLNFGLSYEHRLLENFSLYYHADVITLLVFNAMGFNTELHSRWYPLNNELKNLYFCLGLGYGRVVGNNQLNIVSRIGWKSLREGLITEPFIGYTYSPRGFSQCYIGISSGWSF